MATATITSAASSTDYNGLNSSNGVIKTLVDASLNTATAATFDNNLQSIITVARDYLNTYLLSTGPLVALYDNLRRNEDFKDLQESSIKSMEKDIRRIHRMKVKAKVEHTDLVFEKRNYEFYQAFVSYVLVTVCVIFIAIGFAYLYGETAINFIIVIAGIVMIVVLGLFI